MIGINVKISDTEIESDNIIDFNSEEKLREEELSQTEVTTEDEEDELSEDVETINGINEDPTLVSIDDLTSKKEQSTKMIPEKQDWLEENMDSWIDDDEDLSPMSTMSSVNLQWTELEGLVELSTVDTDKEVGDL